MCPERRPLHEHFWYPFLAPETLAKNCCSYQFIEITHKPTTRDLIGKFFRSAWDFPTSHPLWCSGKTFRWTSSLLSLLKHHRYSASEDILQEDTSYSFGVSYRSSG